MKPFSRYGVGVLMTGLAFLVGTETCRAEQKEEKVKVLIAKQTIPQYTFIKEQDRATLFDEVEVPKIAVSEDAILAERFNEDVKERTLLVRLSKGKYLAKSDLSGMLQKRLEHLLKEGERAFSIKVAPESAVGGYVMPGDKVDVIATFTRDRENAFAGIVLEAVEVLAVFGEVGKDDSLERADSITLRLKPEEVLILAYYADSGTLRLAKRRADDATRSDPNRRTFKPKH